MEEISKEKIELIKQSFEFKHQKKYKEAIEMLYKALEYDSGINDNVELLSQIGDLHILLNNYDRAIDEFQKALSINQSHVYSLQKCYEIYFKTNQLNKALKIAQYMCEINKTSENYYNYITALIALEKDNDAIELFNSLDETIKLDVNLLYLLSTISNDKKEILLERIISIDETHTEANLDLATIEFQKGNYDKVIQHCLNIEEENPLALYYLAIIESLKHNYTKAIELFSKAIELDKDEHDFYLALAKTYIDISWLDEALLALRKSINLSLIKNNHTQLDEKYFLSAWILIKQNQISKALLNLDSISKDSKFYSKAQILIQTINLKNQNLATALNQLEKYYQQESNNPILLDSLAIIYKELKQYKKAIDIYRHALELYPDSIYYNLEIIDLLIDDKDYESATKIINNVKNKYKNCANIYNSLARIYYRLNDLGSALSSISEYLELDKNNQEAFYFKGLILNDLSNYLEAKKHIYIAMKLDPTKAKYYSQMARSYAGLNDYESALLYSKEAIELDQNEINYKKQAYDISVLIGNETQMEIYYKQLKRSEEVLKQKR